MAWQLLSRTYRTPSGKPRRQRPIVALYAGAGFTSYHHDPDQGDASWNTGVNFLFGANASIRRMKPFGEIKYTTQGKDGVVLTLGTRFHLFD